jgi:hypothetical protein
LFEYERENVEEQRKAPRARDFKRRRTKLQQFLKATLRLARGGVDDARFDGSRSARPRTRQHDDSIIEANESGKSIA